MVAQIIDHHHHHHHHHRHHVLYPLQSIGAAEAGVTYLATILDGSPLQLWKSGQEFGQGACDSSTTLREGHCGIFNVH